MPDTTEARAAPGASGDAGDEASCRHCGSPIPSGADAQPGFCCQGCAGAYALVQGLGLDAYYRRRTIDADVPALKPDEELGILQPERLQQTTPEGRHRLHLFVEGIHCAACVWLIESVLARQPGLVEGRVNMTTRRLAVTWEPDQTSANDILEPVLKLGYRLVPYDPGLLGEEQTRDEKALLRAMAIAGFAAANVMLLSVSIWAGHSQGMGPATRDMLHWISALIALPAVAVAGLPFYRSALGALKARRVNMDVPISLGVILASAMSLHETAVGNPHAYFDSAITLLFFLLIGRYLDRRARGRARSAAEQLLGLSATAVTILDESGARRVVAPEEVVSGMTVLVAAGERVSVDGTVVEGVSDIDASLISGETLPQAIEPGGQVFAGTLNLTRALTLRVDAVGEGTLLAEIVRLMENAEQGRAAHVALADRVAKGYSPVVHLMALGTFLGWFFLMDVTWQQALMNAIAVLIITCPCALALAVPVVQVIASARLLKLGVLVKSPTALERLARVKRVVFDKTGTVTDGRLELLGQPDGEVLSAAARLAGSSKHPLARALAQAAPRAGVAGDVAEEPGQGLSLGSERLGRASFVGVPDDVLKADRGSEKPGPELWYRDAKAAFHHFRFADKARADAGQVMAALSRNGYSPMLLSGDQSGAVEAVADEIGLTDWHAEQTPGQKCEALDRLEAEAGSVMMIGDGLNDAPALARASVSMSPSSAVDVSQTAADLVFQGNKLRPVLDAIGIAKRADVLVKQNFGLAFAYNVITIPLAVTGYVTPLLAAIAMSTSSIIVIANAVRLNQGRPFKG
ncbi:MAG: heavy metal translocating P-type ATPase metal-binding domain-containing protein [Magnetovibrionaceae bacterium]